MEKCHNTLREDACGCFIISFPFHLVLLKHNKNTSLEKCHNSLMEDACGCSIISFPFHLVLLEHNKNTSLKKFHNSLNDDACGWSNTSWMWVSTILTISPITLVWENWNVIKPLPWRSSTIPSGRMHVVVPMSTPYESHYETLLLSNN